MKFNEDSSPVDPAVNSTDLFDAAMLRRWLTHGWQLNDLDILEEHFHPQCVISGLIPEVIEGIAEMRAAHRSICGRMHHRATRLHHLLVQNGQFSAAMEMEGEHCDSGLDVAFEVSTFGSIKYGLIVRAHTIIDYSGVYSKLGLLDGSRLGEIFG